MTNIYFWCTGQDENIGDVLLRRRMLRTLRLHGVVHAYVGPRASDGFIESLIGNDERVVLHRAFLPFVRSATASVMRRSGVLVFNPGEIRCSGWYAKHHGLLLPTQLVARLRGVPIIRAGVGTRNDHWFWKIPLVLSVRLSTLNIWRDEFSRSVFGQGTVMPDWGFDERLDGVPAAGALPPRTLLAVSLRGDRPPQSDEWVNGVRATAQRLGLRLVALSQVKRDTEMNRQLSVRLGCDLVDWPTDVSHREQERAVRDVYQRSALVLSDRLHGLIMGISEGALPVGLVEREDAKTGGHFEAASIPRISADSTGWSSEKVSEFIEGVMSRREEIDGLLADARERVRDMDVAIAAALTSQI